MYFFFLFKCYIWYKLYLVNLGYLYDCVLKFELNLILSLVMLWVSILLERVYVNGIRYILIIWDIEDKSDCIVGKCVGIV